MKTPPSPGLRLSAVLVSPTLIIIALAMLFLPLNRLVAPRWPSPIVEYVYPDGSIELDDARITRNDDGAPRSRPLDAARVALADGRSLLGYVVGLRPDGGRATTLPAGTAWRPGDFARSPDCLLGFRVPLKPVQWLRCDEALEVSKPNRLHLLSRARLAIERGVPALAVW